MRLGLLLIFGVISIQAQNCQPTSVAIAGQVSGQFDSMSCVLSDSTAYLSYRLSYPVRGRIQISLNAPADGAPVLGLILRDSSGALVTSGPSISTPVESGAYTLLVNAPA